MTGRRRIAALVALLAGLSGCASAGPRGATPPTGTDTGTTPRAGSSLPSPALPLSPGPTRCPTRGTAVIPDGTWDGPLRLRVTSVAGVPATRSTGSGRLQLLVQGGKVVQGVWTLTGRTKGEGPTSTGEATVRLTARVAGSVRGPATKPLLHGAWAVSGTVRITSPVRATVPVAASGEGDAAMTVRAGGCDTVTGTFAPPAAGQDPLAGLGATARWAGRRQG
jgi:hypothetical protein